MQPNGSMLRLARQKKGFHQKDAAPLLGVEQPVLSRIENGMSQPDDSLLERAVRAYQVPLTFFFLTDTIYGPPVSVHALWRKKADVTARELDSIVAELNIRAMHMRRLLEGVELRAKADIPRLDVDDFDGVDRIAALVRAHWKLPSGPVRNLTSAAERAGIVVMLSNMAGAAVSGVTFAVPGLPPLVVINEDMPSDRRRFTLAHEIGHLVMHRFPSPTMEDEANEFAACLLMPEADIRPAFIGRRIDVSLLGALKQEWRVAMSALLMRASSLGFLTEGQQQYLWKQFSILKIRMREPVQYDFPHEEPTVVSKIFEVHRGALGYDDTDLAKMLHVFPQSILEYYGVRFGGPGNKPRLTIVT
jgi:Zn-dependent peptidase ImmA (M78 family)/transcriptional regulator with XRE-family HTH domain